VLAELVGVDVAKGSSGEVIAGAVTAEWASREGNGASAGPATDGAADGDVSDSEVSIGGAAGGKVSGLAASVGGVGAFCGVAIAGGVSDEVSGLARSIAGAASGEVSGLAASAVCLCACTLVAAGGSPVATSQRMINATIKVPSEHARAQAAALYVRRASFLSGSFSRSLRMRSA
jgi:hypothetical protein